MIDFTPHVKIKEGSPFTILSLGEYIKVRASQDIPSGEKYCSMLANDVLKLNPDLECRLDDSKPDRGLCVKAGAVQKDLCGLLAN